MGKIYSCIHNKHVFTSGKVVAHYISFCSQVVTFYRLILTTWSPAPPPVNLFSPKRENFEASITVHPSTRDWVVPFAYDGARRFRFNRFIRSTVFIALQLLTSVAGYRTYSSMRGGRKMAIDRLGIKREAFVDATTNRRKKKWGLKRWREKFRTTLFRLDLIKYYD